MLSDLLSAKRLVEVASFGWHVPPATATSDGGALSFGRSRASCEALRLASSNFS